MLGLWGFVWWGQTICDALWVIIVLMSPGAYEIYSFLVVRGFPLSFSLKQHAFQRLYSDHNQALKCCTEKKEKNGHAFFVLTLVKFFINSKYIFLTICL